MAYDILIVDDEVDICEGISGILEDEGHEPRTANFADDALAQVALRQPALVILDVWLQGSSMDGLQLLEKMKHDHPNMPIVMISGHGTMDMAVSATKMGAYDFIAKPFTSDTLLHTIGRAIDESRLRQENKTLNEMVGGDFFYEIAGTSDAITKVRMDAEKISAMDSRVFITGASGTGQNLLARLIHRQSARAEMPFVTLRCASLSEKDLEPRLLGVEAKGAEGRRIGALEEAHGGTLLLDEVTDMSLDLQRKMARILHNTKFKRLGGEHDVDVNVRIMATSSKNVQALIEEQLFSEDLYYRLNVSSIVMPSLKNRKEDIPALAEAMIDLFSRRQGVPVVKLGTGGQSALLDYDWQGNLLELNNVVEKILLGSKSDSISALDIQKALSGSSPSRDAKVAQQNTISTAVMEEPLKRARELFEIDYFMYQLKRFDGNISRTADFVGMDRAALHRKLKGLGIDVKSLVS